MKDELLELNLSDNIRNKALHDFNGELAWKRADIPEVLRELIQKQYSIIGIELWAAETYDEEDRLESMKVLFLNVSDIIKGKLPLKDGSTKAFRDFFEPKENETYTEFVKSSSSEATDSINQMNAELFIAKKYEFKLFYHLIFTDEF
ncbi:MAG: hypothetical protein KAH48_00410 [Chlorobi bacterium]|nr:hypothetical protein [Chlorobiota bacterium]